MAREKIVPRQVVGSRTGATSSVETRSIRAAVVLYYEAKGRLLDVNNWYRISGKKGARFLLTDAAGNALDAQAPEIGNLIRIELPAPPNETGDGFDWVRVEAFEDHIDDSRDEVSFGFRVRPVSNPASRSSESAHFYTSEATSSFIVVRKGTTVCALERGRNEKPNPTGGFLNRVRNAVIAVFAMIGLSKPQWKLLTRSILEPRTSAGSKKKR